MTHAARIVADSVSPDGVPLTTFEITFPRIVLAEFNTHRVFSRNSASSRAIPVPKMIEMVMRNPYVPREWGKNQKGMQADQDVLPEEAVAAEVEWLRARDFAVDRAMSMLELGIHKQTTNRLLEPFMWHTCLVTSTEWSNFFHLRNNPKAHPDIQRIARMMQKLYEAPDREPEKLDYGDWHKPLVYDEDFNLAWEQGLAAKAGDSHALDRLLCKVSVGRCARVSYLTHDGKRDLKKDIELHDELLGNGHMSPFEHVARPMDKEDASVIMGRPTFDSYPHEVFCGNIRGWMQLRKMIPFEQDILAPR